MIDNKPCKGNGRAKGHGCGKLVPVQRYGKANRKFGLGISCGCYTKWIIGTDNGQAYFDSQLLRNKRNYNNKIKKEANKRVREQKEKLKSISQLISEAKKPFQKWIRLRDINKGCISCGTTDSDIWDAGHYLKAELYTGLIFDETNVHKQCRKCNSFLGGNEVNYRKGLINRFGEDFVNNLEESANDKRQYKYTREELLNIKLEYLEKIKNYK